MTSNRNSTPSQPQKYRWIILLFSWLIYFCFGLIHTTLSVLVTPIMVSLRLTYSQMGIVLGSWQLVYIFFAQPAGIIIDRVGPYKSLLIGIIVISISAALRWFAGSFISLFLLIALFGIGGPMISVGLPKLTALWFNGNERGIATGVYPTGNAIGGIVALSFTNTILMPLLGDWRTVFLAYSGTGFLIAALWFFIGRQAPRTMNTQEQPHHNFWQMVKKLFQHKNIWLIVCIGVSSFLAGHGLSNWLPTILEAKDINPHVAGYIVSLLKLGGILGSLLIHRLESIIQSKKTVISITLFSFGMAIAAIGFTSDILLWIVVALTGVMMRGLLPLLLVTLMDLPEVGPSRMGIVGGLYFSIGEIGGFSGPFIMGVIKETTGSFIPGLIFFAIISELMIFLTVFLDL